MNDQERFSIVSHIITKTVAKELRTIFKKEWDGRYPKMPWTDDNLSLTHFTQIEKSVPKRRSSRTNTKYLKNTGNRDDWDVSALFQAILFSRSLDLKNRKNKVYLCIDELRNIRNSIAHHSNQSLGKKEFNDILKQIKKSMMDLNCSTAVLEIEAIVKEKIFYRRLILLSFVILTLISIASNMALFTREQGQLSTNILDPDNFYFPSERKPSYFQGRETEISEISQCLQNGSFHIVNIIGMPAIGKTSTAIAVGKELKDKFNRHVVFIDYHGTNSKSAILSKLARSVTGNYSIKFDTLTPEYEMLLQKLYNSSTTLIFDNTEDILLDPNTNQEFRKFITKLITESVPGFNILCTSRLWFDVIRANVANIRLKPLNTTTSMAILKSLHFAISPDHAFNISKLAGGVPLLLELIGSHLECGIVDVADLISMIQEQNIFVVSEEIEDMTDDTNLYKLINLLYERMDPFLSHMFVSLSIFESSFTKDAAIHVSYHGRMSEESIRNIPKAIGRLQKLCLLENLTGANRDRQYAMHHVLRTFILELSTKDPAVHKKQLNSIKRKQVYFAEHLERWEEVSFSYRDLLESFIHDP